MRLGVSTYSYWHFTPERVEIETVIDKAAELDLDGVEILHRQMASEEKNYLQNLKRRAFIQGLDLYALSIHQGPTHIDRIIIVSCIDQSRRTSKYYNHPL